MDEPVRGSLPDRSFYSLPGIERLRAWNRRLVPLTPVTHLTGARAAQADAGSMVGFLSELAWFQMGDGTVDTRFCIGLGLETVAMTVAPPGTQARVVAFSVADIRPCTLKSKTLAARSRVLHTRGMWAVAEVVCEDAMGRSLAQATGRVLIEAMDPPPPPARPLSPVEAPIYPTPDPYLRPIQTRLASVDEIDEMGGWLPALSAIAEEKLPHPPICELIGIRFAAVTEGFFSAVMPADDWLVSFSTDEVAPAYVAVAAHLALGTSAATLAPSGHHLVVLEQNLSFLRPVPTDGRDLLVQGSVTHEGQFLVSRVEVTNADGHQVALGNQTSLVAARQRDRTAVEHARVLATVLFTDIVGSTEKAEQLGDARWGDLLEQHHRIVRSQLADFKGREVKTTGDGFLAIFDSPGRGVQCARAIRDGVQRLGLEIRVGLHTGECELSGADVAGIAVHLAARVQGQAGPGEIVVSGTVHDLVAGSGLRFVERGRHQLKGIEGEWLLFALDV